MNLTNHIYAAGYGITHGSRLYRHLTPITLSCAIIAGLSGAYKALDNPDAKRLIKKDYNKPHPECYDTARDLLTEYFSRPDLPEGLSRYQLALCAVCLLYRNKKLSKTQTRLTSKTKPDNPVAYVNEGGNDLKSEIRL